MGLGVAPGLGFGDGLADPQGDDRRQQADFAKRPKPLAGATPPPEPSAEQKKAAFDKADANHDGVLSREEFKTLPKPPRPPKPPKG